MGKISMFSRAMVVMTSAADRLRSDSSTAQLKVKNGTSTGIDAHRNTHIASRYFLRDRCCNSLLRTHKHRHRHLQAWIVAS